MDTRKGTILGLIAGALWGLDGVLMGVYFDKTILREGESIILLSIIGACIHDGLAAIWIFIKNILSNKRHLYKAVIKEISIKTLIFGAILGGPIGMTGSLLGIQFSGASYTSGITASYPVLGAILGIVFLKEKVSAKGIVGIITAVLGAVIISYSPPDNTNYLYFYIGIGCAIFAVIGWSLEGVLSTYSMKYIEPDIAIGIREMYSFLTYLIVISAIVLVKKMVISDYINYQYSWIVVLSSIVGAFSFLCWYHSMKILGVSIAMSLNITYALWVVLFCVLLTGLKVTQNLIIGVIVITIGTMFTIFGKKDEYKKD